MALKKFFKEQYEEAPAREDAEELVQAGPALQNEPEPPAPSAEVMTPQRTVVGAVTKVKGDIESDEATVVSGQMEGNIVCTKQVTVDGVVVGNITCQAFALNSGSVTGNIVCEGGARVAEGSTVEGDVSAQELALGGTLKGNAQIKGMAKLFSEKACMQGDLTATRYSVMEGAIMSGRVEIVPPEAAAAPARTKPARKAAGAEGPEKEKAGQESALQS